MPTISYQITDIAALIPLTVVFFSMLIFRKPAVFSNILGICTAFLISIYIGFQWQPFHILNIIFASVLLTLTVALVIIPGFSFNSLFRSHGFAHGLTKWIEELPINREAKTLLILLGLAPAIESLTGFGVSLFLTISILYPLYSLKKTAQLGSLSMNIMPWGTLAMATVIGGMLINHDPQELGFLTSLTSSLIYPYIGIISALVISDKNQTKNIILGFFIGSLLSLTLIISNWLLSTEVAGVISGFIVCIAGVYFLKNRPIEFKQGLILLLPYLALLGLVLFQRMIPGFYEKLSQAWILTASGVTVSPFTSPGLLLALVTFALFIYKPSHSINIKEVLKKSKKPLLGMGLFFVLSQVLVQTGMLKALVSQIGRIFSDTQIVLISPILGALSGLATGSNVGGNALLIRAQYEMGIESSGNEQLAILLTALQNSGAGHAVFSSIPMIILLLGILHDESDGKAPTENEVLRFTLCTTFGILILLSISGYILMRIMI